MAKLQKEKKWFNPMSELDDEEPKKKKPASVKKATERKPTEYVSSRKSLQSDIKPSFNIDNKNWMRNFDPVNVEDLAVNAKKIQEVEVWLSSVSESRGGDMLLLTGPVGCGKTITAQTLAKKHGFKVTEWITPMDIDIPSDYGDYEFREKQSTKFLDFIISAANFTSLLDDNNRKLILVEDFPNTFMRSPTEFTNVLEQFKNRAKSPIVFICSESHNDNKHSAMNLFNPQLKEQFNISHIALNGVATTGLKAALKRVAEIINKEYSSVYKPPTADVIECVVNSAAGDVRSAVLNLHFACLKGSNQRLETSQFIEKDKSKSKVPKKKTTSSKFASIGKDQTVSILHGVGRVLNPKLISIGDTVQLSHPPCEVTEQFVSQPGSFVGFLHENYLPHYSTIDDVQRAARALSDADCLLAEWRDRIFQEYGIYIAAAGLMLANTAPVSAWHPVRGPKNMRVQYPTTSDIPLLEPHHLYKGKVLVSDFKTYCKIINRNA